MYMHVDHANYLIMNDECLVYIHSLDFPLNTHITKIVQFHIHKFDQQQGQFRRSWSYLYHSKYRPLNCQILNFNGFSSIFAM